MVHHSVRCSFVHISDAKSSKMGPPEDPHPMSILWMVGRFGPRCVDRVFVRVFHGL